MAGRMPRRNRSLGTLVLVIGAVLALSACANTGNSDPAAAAINPGIDPRTLTTEPLVDVPDSYSGDGVIHLEPSARTAPGRIGEHFVPVGPVWDMALDGQDRVEFEDDPATLFFEYDPSKLAGAGVLEEFVVFVFDEGDAEWKRVEATVPVIEGGIHYIRAKAGHLSSFVAAAAASVCGVVVEVPDMDSIFPDGIGGCGGARFALIDESFRYYLDRDYYLVPAGFGAGESAANHRTFTELGLDGSVGIATYNGGSPEHPFSAHKHFAGSLYIDFIAHMDLDLYVLYDTRGGEGPKDTTEDASWLVARGFQAIEDDEGPFYLETTDPVGLYRVYKKSYDYGDRIWLHGNRSGAATTGTASIQTNYWVILKPQGSAGSDTSGELSQIVSVSRIFLPDGPIHMSQVGATKQRELTPVLEPANATNRTIHWSTSDYTIVNVTRTTDGGNPYLIAVNPGTAEIEAVTEEGGHSATVEVVIAGSPDQDGDTVPDAVEESMNPGGHTDGDLLPDHLDADDDSDGIPTAVERQLIIELHPDWLTDDFDSDGVPDFYDLDSDGDGIPDSIEAHDADSDGIADRVATGTDTDGDGLDDAFDPDNGGVPAPLPDADGDGWPNYLDPDS